MPVPLSMDLRKRIVDTYKTTLLSQEEVAERYQVGVASVVRLVAMSKKGSLEPKKPGTREPKGKIAGDVLETLRGIVNEHPDMTNPEFLEKLQEATGVQTSVSAISRAIKKLGFTRKKNSICVRKEQRKSTTTSQGIS